MSGMFVVREYKQSRSVVWRALTDPGLVPLWTSTGQGGKPEGFNTEVGTKFRYIGKPFPGWDGIVRCQVLEVDEPRLLRYDWRNKDSDDPTFVTNLLDELPMGGTRLTWEHTGFHGVEGIFMSRLLARVRRKMLTDGLPAALAQLDDGGSRAGCHGAPERLAPTTARVSGVAGGTSSARAPQRSTVATSHANRHGSTWSTSPSPKMGRDRRAFARPVTAGQRRSAGAPLLPRTPPDQLVRDDWRGPGCLCLRSGSPVATASTRRWPRARGLEIANWFSK